MTSCMFLSEKLQKRTFDLVSNAYTSIRAEDLAKLMGITREAALSGWCCSFTAYIYSVIQSSFEMFRLKNDGNSDLQETVSERKLCMV